MTISFAAPNWWHRGIGFEVILRCYCVGATGDDGDIGVGAVAVDDGGIGGGGLAVDDGDIGVGGVAGDDGGIGGGAVDDGDIGGEGAAGDYGKMGRNNVTDWIQRICSLMFRVVIYLHYDHTVVFDGNS